RTDSGGPGLAAAVGRMGCRPARGHAAPPRPGPLGASMSAQEPRVATILVVEDEEPIQDLVTTALRFRGFQVVTATSGQDALRAVANAAPNLIVLDVNLPDVDGFEVCRRLRADGRQMPVVFLTARDELADLRTGFTQGGDDYVTKPFS